MIENEQKLQEVLETLDKEGILNNVILIGSWSLLFYKRMFESFEPDLRTRDIDLYVPNSKKIKDKFNIVESFRIINFDMFHDCLTNRSYFSTPDGFEVEFITGLTRDNLPSVKLGNTPIYAESISYVDIFKGNYVEVEYNGLKVNIVSPVTYVLQKLLINALREEKNEKDIGSVKNVLRHIKTSRKFSDELLNQYNQLPKKWKKKIDQTAKESGIELLNNLWLYKN